MIRRAGLVLALFCLRVSPEILLEHRSIDAHNHVSLVADVHDYYKASCVTLIKSGNHNDPSATGQMHSWFLQFSRRGIFSVVSTFSKLADQTEKYYKRISRPLFVVFLDTNESMDEFALATRKLRISFPIWLVLFTEHPGNPLKEFCQRPKGNPFNLGFNTEMLVLCYNDPVLKEWYAHGDNHTRVSNLATWSLESGFIPFSKKSLYARRNDMLGKTMRAITGEHSVYVSVNNGVLEGFMGEVVKELGAFMNFTTEITEPFEKFGYWHEDEGSWMGAIGEVVTGRVDLGIAEFSFTSHRIQAVDFTMPLVLTCNRVYFKQPSNSVVKLSQYFKAFDYRSWGVMIGFIVVAPILLTVIKMKGWISTKVVMESYLHVWGIYCQQGLPELPEESSARLVFFSIFVSALIICSAYSAFLTSYLTLATGTLPFKTLEGFANDGTYKMIVLKNTASFNFFMNTQDTFFQKFKPLMKRKQELPFTLMNGYAQTCTSRVGFHIAEGLTNAFPHPIPCKMININTGNVESYAMILSKNNPYTGLMNYYLQRFQDYGILKRLRGPKSSPRFPQESEHDAVTIWDIVPLFSILAGGIVLAFFLLLVEIVVFWKVNKSQATGLNAQGAPGILVTSRQSDASAPENATDLRNCDNLIIKSNYEMLRFRYRP